MSEQRYQSFAEFWPYYAREHSVPGCRALHFVGSTLVLVLLAVIVARVVSPWWFFALPFIGYGFAWVGHFVIEKNRPATFKYPFWSFIGDWKMWYLMLTGRMSAELDRINAAPAK
jgi:hypothetical protein